MIKRMAYFVVVCMLFVGILGSGGLLLGSSIDPLKVNDSQDLPAEQDPQVKEVSSDTNNDLEMVKELDQFELAALTEETAFSSDEPCPQESMEIPGSTGTLGSEFWNVQTRAHTNVSTVIEMLEFPISALYEEECFVKGKLQEDNNSDGMPEDGEAAIPHSQVHIIWDPNSFYEQEFIVFTQAGTPPSMEGEGEFNIIFNNTETDIGIKNLEIEFWGQWTQDGANYFELNDTGPEGLDTNGSGTPDTYGCNALTKLTNQQYLFDDDGDATDSDGDGYCDGQESRDGSDPGEITSTPAGPIEPFRNWVDEEFFDWQHATPRPDPWPSWQNPPNPQLLDNDGDSNIDEDVAAFIARFPFNLTLNVALWHEAFLTAKLSTAKVVAGEEFTITGSVGDASLPKGHPNGKMGFKTLQVKFDEKFAGQAVASYVYDASDPEDLSSQYSFTYQMPKDTSAGIHTVEILMNPDISWEDNQYYRPVSIVKEIKVIRPAEIVFDDIGPDAWVYHTNLVYINGSIVDKYFYRNEGRMEGLRLDIDGINYAKQYMFLLYWTKGSTYIQRGPYWINNTNGSFSIPIIVPGDQGLGPVNVSMELHCDGTNYLSTTNSTEYVTRAHTKLDMWLDQNNNGKKNEANTYITRVEYVDEFGNVHFWNTAHIKGVLKDMELSSPTRSVGVAGQEITLWWGYGESWQKQFSTTTDSEGRWSIDVDIEYGHILGPVAIAARFVENPYTCYYDSSSFYDTDGEPFSVVAMTHLTVQNQQVVKGEDILIKGILYDDRNIGVNNRTVCFYWLSEKEKNDYLEDRNNLGTPIGHTSTDTVGRFKFIEWEIPRLQPVGPAYVVATFGGSSIFPDGMNGLKYTSSDAYSKSWSNSILFNVSAHTSIELDRTNELKMTRFDRFTIKGTVWETYHGETLKIPVKAVPVEAYIIDSTNTEYFFGRVNTLYDGLETDGSFQLTDTVPKEVAVGYATVRIQFNGTAYHLESNNISSHEIWTDTRIVVLEKPDDVDNDGKLDFFPHEMVYGNPTRFHIKIYEDNTPVDSNPIPREFGQCWLNISSLETVRYNTTRGVTDENGRHVFNYTKPFRDTQFGKIFGHRDEKVDVDVNITYQGGKFYHPTTKTYGGTIHPPPEIEDDGPRIIGLSILEFATFVAIIVGLVAIATFFTTRWLRKRMRIRGMKRIIRRAADQLVAGNEYTAVIFKSYQKLGAHLRKYGYLRRDSETFREFEEAIKQALPIDRISMNEFLALLEEARYSHHKIGEQQRNEAIKNLRNIESSLEKIILDESAAMKALEALEEADYTETEILLTDSAPNAPVGGVAPPKAP